jgi:outer membrane lipoprotein
VTACATRPDFKLDDVDQTLNPVEATIDFPAHQGKNVMWGGIIVNSQNMQKGTLLEVLAYPLDKNHRPETKKPALGRFLAEHPGYLETVVYAPGRHTTLVGTLGDTRTGKIGEADYLYPVVNTEQLHLWPTAEEQSESRFHFGVGVMIHD